MDINKLQNSIQIGPDVSFQIASTGNYAANSFDIDTHVIPLFVYDCATGAPCSNVNRTQDSFLTHWKPLPIILVNIGRDQYPIPLNLNNGLVPRCAQLILWSGIQWV